MKELDSVRHAVDAHHTYILLEAWRHKLAWVDEILHRAYLTPGERVYYRKVQGSVLDRIAQLEGRE